MDSYVDGRHIEVIKLNWDMNERKFYTLSWSNHDFLLQISNIIEKKNIKIIGADTLSIHSSDEVKC